MATQFWETDPQEQGIVSTVQLTRGDPDQIIASGGAGTMLIWTTVVYQEAGVYWNAGTPTRLTIPEDGWYRVWGAHTWESHATGLRYLSLMLNGVDEIAVDMRPGSSDGPYMGLTCEKEFVQGDFLELRGFQSSGVNRAVMAGGGFADFSPYFAVTRIF